MNHFRLWSLTVNSGHPVKEYPIVMKEIIIKRVFFLNAIEIIVQLRKEFYQLSSWTFHIFL